MLEGNIAHIQLSIHLVIIQHKIALKIAHNWNAYTTQWFWVYGGGIYGAQIDEHFLTDHDAIATRKNIRATSPKTLRHHR